MSDLEKPTEMENTMLSVAEAKRRWGKDVYVKLASGRTMVREFEAGNGAVWKPVFGPGMIWEGHRLTRVDRPAPQYRRRRR